jgi:agmatinase
MELHFLERNAGFGEAKVCLLPVPYEGTVCFGKGASKGPSGIMRGSIELEEYDMELGMEIIGGSGQAEGSGAGNGGDAAGNAGFGAGFHVCAPVEVGGRSAGEVTDSVEAEASRILDAGKFPVVMGGEHSVSVGAVRAAAKKFPGLSVLCIDAHADMRDEYEENKYSHACATRRILESAGVGRCAQVGVRSMSAECAEYAKKGEREGRGRVFGSDFGVEGVLSALGDAENVYITADLDGFDPSEVPAVGTPHPGGISWGRGLELLRAVAGKKRIVGFDIVELAPIEGQLASEIFAAKLLYKLVGYSFFADKLRK